MPIKLILAFLVLRGFGINASADEAVSGLPLLALNPAGLADTPSRWSGFYVGSEVFAVSGSGGLKGGVGGAAEAGYNHAFSNNVVLGVNTAVGYAPSLFRRSRYSGFDFATADVRVGYDMGRLMPYVTGCPRKAAHQPRCRLYGRERRGQLAFQRAIGSARGRHGRRRVQLCRHR